MGTNGGYLKIANLLGKCNLLGQQQHMYIVAITIYNPWVAYRCQTAMSTTTYGFYSF